MVIINEIQELTKEQALELVPKSFKAAITDEFVQLINDCVKDVTIADEFKNNLISYNSVLRQGKFKLLDYVNAVRYVSYKMLGKTNLDAYKMTFPERVARLERDKCPDISPYVSAYNKGQLVVAIMEQTLVPTYILNQHMHQEALNKTYEVMMDDRTKPMTAVKAAEIILNYTKQPEASKMTLDINVNNSAVEEMHTALTDLAKTQRELILSGGNLQNIVEAQIITEEA